MKIQRILLLLCVLFVLSVVPSAAQLSDPTPCVDGVFGGDVGAVYLSILDEHAADPSNSFFSTLTPEKQAMVTECAGKSGSDDGRYNLNQLVSTCEEQDDLGHCIGEEEWVIGRLYDYLDPFTTQICDPDPGGGAPICHEGQYYYVAVVLSGCYTDNVFGEGPKEGGRDSDYLESVGWGAIGKGGDHTLRDLHQSDRVIVDFACSNGAVILDPITFDLIGQPGFPEGGLELNDADVTWVNVPIDNNSNTPVTPPVSGFSAGSSTVWNMTFSNWDVEDVDGIPGDERTSADNWKSPDADIGSNDTLCDGNYNCELDYGQDWFDDVNLWEWQVVYEMRWDVSACGRATGRFAVLDPLQRGDPFLALEKSPPVLRRSGIPGESHDRQGHRPRQSLVQVRLSGPRADSLSHPPARLGKQRVPTRRAPAWRRLSGT